MRLRLMIQRATSAAARPWVRWFLFFLMLSGLSLVIFFLWHPLLDTIKLIGDQEAFTEKVEQAGLVGPAIVFVVQALQIFIAAIPGQVVVITTGYAYGFWGGLLLSIVTTVGISQLVFTLSRWGGRPLVARLASIETITKWDRFANRYGFLFFIVAFMLPIFPADIMNYVAGLSTLTATRFFVANLFGRLPGVIFLTLIGAYGLVFSFPIWLAFFATGILLLIAGQLLIKRLDITTPN